MSWLHALWFFLPAGIANATPVLVNKIPLLTTWKTPLDFGKSYNGHRIFGQNKTFRGLLFGIIVGAFVGYLQGNDQIPGYPESSALLGAVLGAGALIGDAIESFFKRQKGIQSGQKWFPYDQTDYIIGGLLFSMALVSLTLVFAAQVLIVWFGMHLLFAYIGYKLKLKSSPI